MRDRDRWKRFDELDIAKIIIGAMIGFALKYSLESLEVAYIPVLVLALTLLGAISIILLARAALGDLRKVKDELEKDLGRVHTVVHFAQQKTITDGGNVDATATESYRIAKKAVEGASKKIWVIGDYNPPGNVGDAFVTPEYRSKYLHAISQRLEKQVKSRMKEEGALHYIRIIQRPLDVYSRMANRATLGSVDLLKADMVGDEEVFLHCQEISTLRDRYSADSRVRIELFIVPYLPNSPSVLLVDDKELQFTIPTRTGIMSKAGAAQFELLGILQMVAKREAQLPLRFSEVFDDLRNRGALLVSNVAT